MSNHTARVLLIEDNPGDADLVRLRLVEANADMEVSCVDRLSVGLESMHQEPPSLVLLDLNLPDSRGAETIRNVLNQAPGVPVVVLSGQEDEELAAKAVHQGVQDYLVKGDFDGKQLARAMRYAVERQALLTSLDMSRKQQLQFKDEFLSHVSHELRTPLTSIYQFVSILFDGLAGGVTGEQREHLGTVLRSVNQLRTMIDDLLETARAESGKLRVEPRCMVLQDVLRQAVAMLRTSAQEKHIGLELAIDSRIPLVCADPDRVLQILTNLIDNAVKFTAPDGSVVVEACLSENDADFVYVSVSDTGRGISPECKSLIFERLYQDPNASESTRKGLGLGLYIAKELVRLQGGRIWVESQPGHGSIFSFTLPLFSLSKLLLPAITEKGRVREPIALVRVELTPLIAPALGNWRETREHCLDILRRCIFPDRDVVLPLIGNSGRWESLMLVVCADQKGVEILMKRIREQLERSDELKTRAAFKLSTTEVPLPASDATETLEQRSQGVVDSITETVMSILQRQGLDLVQAQEQPAHIGAGERGRNG